MHASCLLLCKADMARLPMHASIDRAKHKSKRMHAMHVMHAPPCAAKLTCLWLDLCFLVDATGSMRVSACLP